MNIRRKNEEVLSNTKKSNKKHVTCASDTLHLRNLRIISFEELVNMPKVIFDWLLLLSDLVFHKDVKQWQQKSITYVELSPATSSTKLASFRFPIQKTRCSSVSAGASRSTHAAIVDASGVSTALHNYA